METIKLANDQVFEIRNHGVIQNTVMKTRIFNINSDLGIAEILSLFQDEANISSITYSMGENIRDIFADCVSFKSIHMDEQGYTIELSTDAVEKRVKQMEIEIAALKAAQEATQTTEPVTEPVTEGTSTTEP
jgi:hypothetical protein